MTDDQQLHPWCIIRLLPKMHRQVVFVFVVEPLLLLLLSLLKATNARL